MITKTRAVAAALAAAVALGAGATSATAAGHGHDGTADGHGAAEHAHGGAAGAPGRHGRHDTSARVAHERRQLVRQIAILDARLAHVSRDTRTAWLDADDRTAVLANVAADRASLADLAEAAGAADGTVDLRSVGKDLHGVHPEVYAQVLSALRRAAALRVTVAADRTALEGITDRDVTAGRTAVDEAFALVSSAVQQALGVRATGPLSVMRGVRADLASASEALQGVEAVLDAGSTTSGPADPTGGTTDPAQG